MYRILTSLTGLIRMDKSDSEEFKQILGAVFELYDKSVSVAALRMWWQSLKRFEIGQIKMALYAHVETSQFSPKPADVIQAILSSDGRPSADEAWGTAIKATDESLTVIWNEDITEAWGIALDILVDGDKVAGRMAFKSAYDRIVEDKRKLGVPVKWIPSLGTDPDGRDEAVSTAVSRGLLTNEQAMYYLPKLEAESPTPLLESGEEMSEEKMRENIERFRRIVQGIGEA